MSGHRHTSIRGLVRAILLPSLVCVSLAAAAAAAAGPKGYPNGLIFQGPYLFCGDESAMFHILCGNRPFIHGMGIYCGINGYTKPDELEKLAYEKGNGTVRWRGKVRGTDIVFDQTASVSGGRIRITVRREGAWPKDVWGTFQILIPVGRYAGAEYAADGKHYIYPVDYSAGWKFPDGMTRLECAAGDPALNLVLECADGISIADHRRFNDPWFVVGIGVPREKPETELFITLPSRPADPTPAAVRWSRIGYSAAGEKVAILEWPKNAGPPALWADIEPRDGSKVTKGRFVRDRAVDYMQSDFATLNFSDVTSPGEYRIVWAGGKTDWFPIRGSVFDDRLWQPTLDGFIPFEMCHADVRLPAGIVTHGACHLDDAARVPAHFTGPDGFVSYECEGTPYKAGDHIDLGIGGWHDAGDFDLNVPAQSFVVWMLSLSWEEFRLDRDVAALDVARRVFSAGKPDAAPDILQQVEWGAQWLLRMQQKDGRVWNGVCENQPQRSGKPVDRITDGKPGTEDDRRVYVDYHADTQLSFVIATAAASRALKGLRPELAAKCLDASRRGFAYFRANKEIYRPGSYTVPRRDDSGRDSSVIAAATELYLTTGDAVYLKTIEELAGALPTVKFEWPLPRDTQPGSWRYLPPFLARLFPRLDPGPLKDAVAAACRRAAGLIADRAAIRPWPMEIFEFGMWGNSPTALARAFDVYWLTKVVPDALPPSTALRNMLWIYGLHPAGDEVFVNGLGFPETKYIYNCHLHAVNGFGPATIPGAVIPGMGGFWEAGVVCHIDEYGWYGNNEACIYTAAQYVFAINAMRAMGF